MSEPWLLYVDRKSFARALRRLCILTGKAAAGDVRIEFDSSYLELSFEDAAIAVEAEGTWPEPVYVPSVFVRKLPRALPPVENLCLAVRSNRFYADRLSVPCRERQPRPEDTPALAEMIHKDSELFDVLVIGSRFSRHELEEAGVHLLYEAAISRLDALCERVAHLLRDYRVSHADITSLCQRHIEDGQRTLRQSDGPAIHRIAVVWEMLATLGVEPGEIKELMDRKLRSAWKT